MPSKARQKNIWKNEIEPKKCSILGPENLASRGWASESAPVRRQAQIQGGPGGLGPPLTLGFEALKFSILGPI